MAPKWKRLVQLLLGLLLLDQLLLWTLLTRPAASLRGLITLTQRESPPYYRLRPALATTWTLWRDAGATQVHTNTLGMRGPERPIHKPPGVRRVVLMGDSVTFGIGVNDGDCFPAQLQRSVTDTTLEFWNAGVPGYAMADFLGQLQTQVLPLQPDLIVLQLSRNDSLVPLRLTPTFLESLRFSGLARVWMLVRFNFLTDHAAYVRDLHAFLQQARDAQVPVLVWPEGVPERASAELVAIAQTHGAEVRRTDAETFARLDGDPHFSVRGNVQAAERLLPLILGRLNATRPVVSDYP